MLEVQPELTPLMAGLAGAATVIARGEAVPPFDVHCPLGSLPLALKTDLSAVPAPIPYLAADAAHLAKWSPRIAALPRPRVALTWSGNPSHDNDRNRSIGLSRLAPLFSLPASFISIQRDLRADDAVLLAGQRRLIHIGMELEDFCDTAAVLALCDVVITVDTAAAHLAGAMGRPVWVLVPFAPDWRWTRDGDTTPWYPTRAVVPSNLARGLGRCHCPRLRGAGKSAGLGRIISASARTTPAGKCRLAGK